MRQIALIGGALLLALPVACVTVGVPGDMAAFIESRGLCDHFRGEIPEPGDDARMNDVNSSIDRYCVGTDRELARLKKKYADKRRLISMLSAYEEQIEMSSEP